MPSRLQEILAQLDNEKGPTVGGGLGTAGAEEEGSGGFTRLLSRLLDPLVDVPELPGGILGDIAERGIEELSSPLGLASAALVPFTGGTSLGLRGIGGIAAKAATRGLSEVAIGGVASTAASEVSSRLPEDLPGPLKFAAALGAGVVGGVGTSSAITRLGGKAATRASSAALLEEVVGGTTANSNEAIGILRKAAARAKDPNVKADLKLRKRQVLARKAQGAEGALNAARARGASTTEQFASSRAGFKGAQPSIDFVLDNVDSGLITRLEQEVLDSSALNIFEKSGHGGAVEALSNIFVNNIVPPPAELAKLERVFGKAFVESVTSLKPLGFKGAVMQLINLPRAMVASSDLSFPMNQGIFTLASDPVAWAKGTAKSARAFVDPAYADELDVWVRGATDDVAHNAAVNALKRGGTDITGSSLNPEEAFQAQQFSEALFGKSVVGSVMRGSERAYTTAANYMRVAPGKKIINELAEMYGKHGDDLVKNIDDIPLPKLQELGNTLNVLTGRSNIKVLKDASPFFNAFFFAPRFLASRFEAPTLLPRNLIAVAKANPAALRNPVALYKSDPILALQAKALGGFMAQGAAFMGLLAAAEKAGFLPDFHVETDPRSSDFGKAKMGPVRYDFWGGYGQIVRTFERTRTQERKTTSGQVRELDNFSDALWNEFLRSKTSPIAGLGWDIKTGSTYVGERIKSDPSSVADQVRDKMMPIFLRDVYEGYTEQGFKGAGFALPGALGVRVTSFQTLADIKDGAAREVFGEDYRDLTGQKRAIVDQDPRVIDKSNEFDLVVGDSFAEAVDSSKNQRLTNEQIISAQFASGQMTRDAFADAMQEQQLMAATRRDEAARIFKVPLPEANSPLQQSLDSWRNLYAQADIGFEFGIQTGEINWEVFGQLESDLFKSLSVEQKAFIDERATATHDSPVAAAYFNNRTAISESEYYEIADTEFARFEARVHRVDETINTYGDLLVAADYAKLMGDIETERRLRPLVSAVRSRVRKAKERYRKANPGIDRALFETGVTDTLLTRAARQLGGGVVEAFLQ